MTMAKKCGGAKQREAVCVYGIYSSALWSCSVTHNRTEFPLIMHLRVGKKKKEINVLQELIAAPCCL